MSKTSNAYKKLVSILNSRKFTDALPLAVSVIGYITGSIALTLLGYGDDHSAPREAISLLSGEYGIDRVFSIFLSEMKIMLIIFICGFSIFPIASSSVILFYKGFTTGYSVAYVYGLNVKISVYFVHALFSSAVLILFAIACKHTSSLSYILNEKHTRKTVAFAKYILDFLFTCGIVFIFISLRCIINQN